MPAGGRWPGEGLGGPGKPKSLAGAEAELRNWWAEESGKARVGSSRQALQVAL